MVVRSGTQLANLRRGVLEYCVLAAIARLPSYAYALEQQLEEWGNLVSPDTSLYPLLARLQRSRRVESQWVESHQGPPRKYYRITSSGMEALAEFRLLWPEFSERVSAILKES